MTTDSEFEQEVARNYRHNAMVTWLDGSFFWLGMSFVATSTILPLYVSHLTDSKMALGLLSMLASMGWLLPQLFTANWVERLPRKKVAVVNVGLFTERLPLFLMAPAALLATRAPTLALVLFFLLFAWHTMGAGAVAVSWQDMIAKVIPLERRGRLIGLTNFAGTGTGVLGAAAAAWFLDHYDFPQGYMLCFAAAAALIFISWIFLSLTREPAQTSLKPPISQGEYWRRLPSIVRADANFRRCLLSRIVVAIGGMAVGFLAVYAVQRWQLPDSQAGTFTASMLIGQALCYPPFGMLGDRMGHKLGLELSALLAALAIGLASVAPTAGYLHAAFALLGASFAGSFLSGSMIAFEFSAPDIRPTYIGLNSTVTGIASGLAPLLGGWLAGVVGYRPLFAIAFVIGMAGFAMLRWTVQDPRRASATRRAREAPHA